MTQASYTAWDGESYEWPPPVGWYEASDQRWWPEGYGPPPPAAPEPVVAQTADPAPAPVAEQTDPSPQPAMDQSPTPAPDSGVHSDPYATMPPQSVGAAPSSQKSTPTVRDVEAPGPLSADNDNSNDGPSLGQPGVAGAGVLGAAAATAGGLAASGKDALGDVAGDVAGLGGSGKDVLGDVAGLGGSGKDALGDVAGDVAGGLGGSGKDALGDVAGDVAGGLGGSGKDAVDDAGDSVQNAVPQSSERSFDPGVDSAQTQIVPPPSSPPPGVSVSPDLTAEQPSYGGALEGSQVGVNGPNGDAQFPAPSQDPPDVAPPRTGYAPTQHMPPPGSNAQPTPGAGEFAPPGQQVGHMPPPGQPQSPDQMPPPNQMPPIGQAAPVGQAPSPGFAPPQNQMPPEGQMPVDGQATHPGQMSPPGQMPGPAGGQFSAPNPQGSFSPPQYTPHTPPGAIPGSGPQMNAPAPQMNAPAPQMNAPQGQSPILAPPVEEKSGGSMMKFLLIGLGVLLLAGLSYGAWALFGGGEVELTGPGSLGDPHPSSPGVDIFWAEQTWYIEVVEPAAIDVETGFADSVSTRVRVTNKASAGSASPLSELTFTMVTPDGEVITEECPFSDDPLNLDMSVDVNGQTEGDVCFIVPGGSTDVLLGIESSEVKGRAHMRTN